MRSLRAAGRFFLVIGLIFSGCIDAQEISKVALTFDVPVVGGVSQAETISQTLFRLFERTRKTFEKGVPGRPIPIGEWVKSHGGDFRNLKSPTVVQLGLFLPVNAAIAREIIEVTIRAAGVELAGMKIDDRVREPVLEAVREKSLNSNKTADYRKVSIWLSPSLENYAQELRQLTSELSNGFYRRMTELDSDSDSETGLDGYYPAVIFLSRWNNTDINSIYSARYIERTLLTSDLGAKAGISSRIWIEPSGHVLAIVASSSMANLARVEQLLEDRFSPEKSSLNDQDWKNFSAMCISMTDSDLRDLYRGPFTLGWADHFGGISLSQPQQSLKLPDKQTRLIALPSSELRELVLDRNGNPWFAAAKEGDNEKNVDLAISISFDQGNDCDMAEIFRKRIQSDFPDVSICANISGSLLMHRFLDVKAVPGFILAVRTVLVQSQELTLRGATPDNRAELENIGYSIDAISAVSGIEPYRMIRELQWGFSQMTYEVAIEPVIPSDYLLAKALDLNENSSSQILRGRWHLETSTPKGRACLLARLMAMRIDFTSIRDKFPVF